MARSPPSQRATIYINKLEAARRQLDAAIRMRFAKEDDLAIHTIAAAAYGILRDMLGKRGRHNFEELIRAGVYSYARSLAHGEMSDAEIASLKQLQIFDVVSVVAEDIKVRGDDVTVDDVPLAVSSSTKGSDWQSMSKAAAFLKHADRDPTESLSLQDVDNDRILMRTCSAYAMVSHHPTPEMRVFYVFWSLRPECRANLKGGDSEIADALEQFTPARRRRACAKLIRVLKKRGN